jgi:hypothetical protein
MCQRHIPILPSQRHSLKAISIFYLRPDLQLALSWAIEFSMRIATIYHFTKSNHIDESKRVWHMPTCYRFFIHQHLQWVLKLPVTEIVITHSNYTKAASYTLPF